MLLLLSILLCAAILYYGQDRLYRACWRKGLSVKLELSDEKAVEGSVLTLTETVSNRKLLPLPLVHIKFVADRSLVFEDDPHASVTDYYYRNDIMTVLSWQRLYRTLSFTCTRRGYYTFRELTATCGNLFFNTNQLAGFPCGKTLCVYPRYVDPSVFDPTFCRMLGSVLTRRFLNEDPFEFRSIRDYQSYDDRKSVNWKASARTGALKVTTHDYTAAQQVRILINLEEFSVLRHDHLLEEGIREKGWILFSGGGKNGKIADAGTGFETEQYKEAMKHAQQMVDGKGNYLAPGLIDIHLHGGSGYDFMDGTREAFQGIASYHSSHGITSMLATTLAGSEEETLGALKAFARYAPEITECNLLGVHLEGPYFNKNQKGAQDAAYIMDPDRKQCERFLKTGCVRRISMAPELPGALELGEWLDEQGIIVSAGHTEADYDMIEKAKSD